MIILGNVINFFACMLMMSIGLIKKKERILSTECVQYSLQALSHFVLGAYSASISGLVSFVRILVFSRVKQVSVWLKLGFIAFQAVLTFFTGADSLIEWFPWMSKVLYTWYLDTRDVVKFKLANMFGLVLWAIHDLHYYNFVGVCFDVLTIITTTVGICMILRDRKNTADPI